MMPLAHGTGTLAQGGGPAETSGPGLCSAELWPKEQGVGGVEAAAVGKGFSGNSLSGRERVQRP